MKKRSLFVWILIIALALSACGQDAPGGEIQLGREYDFSGVTRIKLVNGHNGYATTVTGEQELAQITAFVGETIGKSLGSGEGYYEGSYSVVFYCGEEEVFLVTYGDDNVFYTGTGPDGAPVRYRLTNLRIFEDVIPFFSQYDQSGMVWEKRD